MKSYRWFFVVAILFVAVPAWGQRVGLVLSGGGAKGLYHVGVIKALEENGIPIDYVSGTSMGAIVGGLYAIGYTPEQMEQLFLSSDVRNWITGTISPKHQYFFKQMRRDAAMLTLRFDGDKRRRLYMQLPSHLVSSGQLDLAFAEIFAGADVACGGDFDRLMVPFRCVASDTKNRREQVFSHGDLGKAVRSSMSLPMLYTPMKTKTATYLDGGLFNNFPWQPLAEAFAPDILIGSSVANSGNADGGINEQMYLLTGLHTDYSLPRESDIMIERVMEDVSMMDFGRAAYIMEQGYNDAMAAMPRIKSAIGRRVSAEELAAQRDKFVARKPPLDIESYNIRGLTPGQTEYVRKMLKLDRGDKAYDFTRFRSEYLKILAEGEIEGGYPNLTYDTVRHAYLFDIEMKTKPRLKVMIGGNISSTALNQAYIGVEYKNMGRTANSFNLDGYFSAFHSSVSLGGRTDMQFRAPFYVEYGGSMNYYNYFRSNFGFLSKDNALTYSKYYDNYLYAAIGTPISRSTVLNLNFHYGRDEYRYFQQSGHDTGEQMDYTRLNFYGLKLEFERRSTNHTMYPTRGISQIASGIIMYGKEAFTPGITGTEMGQSSGKASRSWMGARFMREEYFELPKVKWLSFGYLVDVVWTGHPKMLNDYATNISSPTFTPTPHSHIVYMKEFRSRSYVAAGLMPTFEFTRNFYLKTSFYAFLPAEYDRVKENIRQRLRYIFDASLVFQTVIGPVSLSVSQYDVAQRRNNWFLTFNFGYTIFKNKGLFY